MKRRRFQVFAVAALVVAVAAGVFSTRGMLGTSVVTAPPGSKQPQKVAYTDEGLLVRPRTVVSSQDGAVADVPAGPVRYSDVVLIRQIDVPDDDRRWELEGSWQFVSKAGMLLDKPVTIDLPVKGSTVDAKSVVLTVDARWIELPAEQVKLADGRPALRIGLKDVPTPWVVGVARQRPGASKEGELSRLERLYWTDRAKWEAEARDWLSKGYIQSSRPVAVAMAAPIHGLSAPLRARSWVDAQQDLEWALKTLGAVRLAKNGKSGGASPVEPEVAYAKGIDKLFSVRQEWVTYRETWGEEGGVGYDQLLFDDEQTMEQALETALATYAPWGIELTRFLLRSGALKGMDLGVIPAYGELYYTDIAVPKGAVKVTDDAIANAIGTKSYDDLKKIKTGTESVNRYLRLYSMRAVEETSLIDYLKDWKTQAFVRYLPAVLAAAGLISGGTGLVVGIVVDEVINQWQNAYEDTETPYVYASLESAGVAASGASLYMDATQQFVRSSFHQPVDLADVRGTRFSAVQFAYGAALAFAVANSDWYMLKDVRKMTEGSQSYCIKGSCNWLYSQVLPPIQLLAVLKGDLAGEPADAYPTSVLMLMSWTFDTGLVPNLHQLLEEGKPETLASAALWMREDPKGGLTNMGFSSHKQDLWPVSLIRTEPQAQALRIAFPRDALKLAGAAYGVSESAPLGEYGLVLRLEQADGKRNVVQIADELATPPGGDASKVYAAVVLRVNDADEVIEVPKDYTGPQQEVDGGSLMRKTRGSLTMFGADDVLWEGQVNFGPEDKMVQADASDVESARIHLKEIATEFDRRASIKAINPSTAWYDEEITIIGTGLGASMGNGRVSFYRPGTTTGIIGKPTSWSDKAIKVKVPRGVLDGDHSKEPTGTVEVVVLVPNPKGLATEKTNRAQFEIGVAKAQITAIEPAKAKLDAEVTIKGKGFGATRGNSSVTFKDKTITQVISWSDTAIKLKRPRNAMSGDVIVTVGGVKSNPVRFEVDYFAHLKAMNRLSIHIENAKLIYEETRGGEKRPPGAGTGLGKTLDSANIVWKNNSFTTTFTETLTNGYVMNYSVSGTIDESGERLLEATIRTSGEDKEEEEGLTMTRLYQFKLSNLPLQPDLSPTYLIYSLEGAAVSGHVSDISDDESQSNGMLTRSFRSVDWGATKARVRVGFNMRSP